MLREVSRIIASFLLTMDHLELSMDLIISVIALVPRMYLLNIHLILVVYKFP